MCCILLKGGGLILTMPLGDYNGACNLGGFEKLLEAAKDGGLRCDAQDYYIAQGRRWRIISGKGAIEKVKALLNTKKIIVCLSFTKKLESFKEGKDL